MRKLKRTVSDPIDITDLLAPMDLTQEYLSTAVRFGEARRDACTPNDAPVVPSFLAWAGTLRKLRDDAPIGVWEKSDRSLNLIINRSKRIAISVASGGEHTGDPDPDATPTTKRAVGIATRRAVFRNRQGVLDLKYANVQDVGEENCITYLLLRRRENDKVFWELSVPDVIGIDGFVVGWSERVVFPPIDLEPSPSAQADDEQTSKLSVPVNRKAQKKG
jgi:hypothetical protein